MRHILYISHSNGFHGAERVLLARIRHACEEGDRVTLLVPSLAPECKLEQAVAQIGGVEILHLRYRSAGVSLMRTLLVMVYNLPALFYLFLWCRREKVNELYSNTYITILGVLLARITGLPHHWHFHEPVDRLFDWHPHLRRLYRKLCKTRRSEVIFISQRQRSEWENELGIQIVGHVEYNPIQPIVPIVLPAHQGIRIGYLGHFEKRKNLSMLIHVFEQLHDEYPETELWLCGAEAENEYQEILSCTTLRTPVLRVLPATQDVARFYGSIDIFCLPSLRETMPLVSLEAIGCGVCTLQTDQSGLSELLSNGTDTLFLSPNDPNEWLTALKKCMNPSYRNAIATSGYNKWKSLCEL